MAGTILISSEPSIGLPLNSFAFHYLADRIWEQFDPALSVIRDEIYLPKVQAQMFITLKKQNVNGFRAFVDAVIKAKKADPNANEQGVLRSYYGLWDKLIEKLKEDPRYPPPGRPASIEGKD
jgi:hypothetical protein